MKRQTISFDDATEKSVEDYRMKKGKTDGKIPSFQSAVLELIRMGLET